MLIYVLFLVLLFCFIQDFKKGIIYYAPFKFLFSHGIPSHVGAFELDTLFTFVLFGYWCLINRNEFRKFPLKKAILVMEFASLVYACNPHFAITVLLDSLSPYLYLIMFFSVIRKKSDVVLFTKVICVYVLVLNGNAICELVGYNVVGNQLLSVMTPESYWADDAGMRGAFFRLHSFVPHSIGYGVENVVFLAYFFMIYMYRHDILKKEKAMFYMAVCLIGVFFSGSRSPLLGGIIILLPFIANKKMFNTLTRSK